MVNNNDPVMISKNIGNFFQFMGESINPRKVSKELKELKEVKEHMVPSGKRCSNQKTMENHNY